MSALNRRRFCQLTAASLALGASRALAAESDRPRPQRKFTMGLSCGAIGVGASFSQAVELAVRFGFESIEPPVDHLARLSDGQLQELLADLKAKRLAWGAAGLPIDFRGDEPRFAEGLKPLAEFAQTLQRAGVTRVATWLNPSHRTLTYVANFRQHARRLREAAKVLGDRSVRLGLEYVGPKTAWTAGRFPFIHTMAEMKDLVAEIGRDNVGFLLDSWHWYTAQETGADLLSLRNADVVLCHLNDAPKGVPVDQQVDNRRDLPGATGVIDLKTFLRSLAEIGYDGPIVAEPFRPDLSRLPRDEAVGLVADAMKKAFALVP
jgi:sugar phosphate isomerase/epimerase